MMAGEQMEYVYATKIVIDICHSIFNLFKTLVCLQPLAASCFVFVVDDKQVQHDPQGIRVQCIVQEANVSEATSVLYSCPL